MKKIFTLCVLALLAACSNAQVVLNEVYTDPGSGKNEFFELYNTSTSITPENLDNYTLVAYYEESGKSGFYVLDLPNQTITAKSFFVGASASPISVQAQTGLVVNFSWNASSLGSAISKWEKSGASYVAVAVPANLNDLFVKRTGVGAVHHIFVYKNGMLINGLIGGTNSNTIPSYIKSMPDLFVDMSGASTDFTIKFSSMSDNSVEYTNSSPGSDNGYIRNFDGKCGTWDKSSASSSHTPGKSNGSAAGVIGTVTIAAIISEISGSTSTSLLSYNITAGPAEAFPVMVQIYQDLGVIGELDASDILVNSKQINDATAGEQNLVLPFHNDPVMLVVKSAAGCYDAVLSIQNLLSPLPVHLISFQGNMNKNNKVTLNWTVADNETVSNFEIERSFNGKDFTSVAVVFGTEKMSTESYMYYETLNNENKVMYRLKMIDKGHDIDYSRILIFNTKTIANNTIKIIGNPVTDKLTFSYTSSATQMIDVKVYDMSGRTVLSNKVNSAEGNNVISLPLSSTFKTGMYVVEVNDGSVRQSSKFIKQ